MGMDDLEFEKATNMYADVNKFFGGLVKVTPSSKVVGDLAILLTKQNLTVDDILNNPQFDLPDSSLDMLRGSLGTPSGGWPKEIIDKLNIKPNSFKGGTAAAVDFDEVEKYLEVSERIERALRKTRIRATTKLFAPSPFGAGEIRKVRRGHSNGVRHASPGA